MSNDSEVKEGQFHTNEIYSKQTEKDWRADTCEVISYARLDNALNDLRYNGKIGNWPVAWKIFLIRKGFLEKRKDDGMFKLRAEFTSRAGPSKIEI